MSSQSTVLHVEGMSCNHCVNSIKKAIGQLAGVESVEVDLQAKQVTISFKPETVSIQIIKETIEDQGYEVK